MIAKLGAKARAARRPTGSPHRRVSPMVRCAGRADADDRCPNTASLQCDNDCCRACCKGCSFHKEFRFAGGQTSRCRRCLERDDIIDELGLRERDFNSQYDYVYRDTSTPCRRRGSENFIWPAGWKKLALDLSHHSGSSWLDRNDGWPVAFHGTSGDDADVIKDIVRNGFKIRGGSDKARHGEQFGPGIYCTPEPDFAARYAKNRPWETDSGHTLEVVFQVRVRPGSFTRHQHKYGDCWRVLSPSNIRPCGILLRERFD